MSADRLLPEPSVPVAVRSELELAGFAARYTEFKLSLSLTHAALEPETRAELLRLHEASGRLAAQLEALAPPVKPRPFQPQA